MSRSSRTFRAVLAATTVGLLTLTTACRDKEGSDSPKYIAPSTTVAPDDTAVDSTVDSTATGGGTGTTVKAGSTGSGSSGGSGSSTNVVDADLEQAIADAEAILAESEQDLKDAQNAAANGG